MLLDVTRVAVLDNGVLVMLRHLLKNLRELELMCALSRIHGEGFTHLCIHHETLGRLIELLNIAGLACKSIEPMLDQMRTTLVLHHTGTATREGFQSHVAKGLHVRREEKHICRGVGFSQRRARHPSTYRYALNLREGSLKGPMPHDNGLDRDALLLESFDHTDPNVHSLLGHETTHPKEDHIIVVNALRGAEGGRAALRIEELHVHSSLEELDLSMTSISQLLHLGFNVWSGHIHHWNLLIEALQVAVESVPQYPVQQIVLQIFHIITVPSGHIGNVVPLAPLDGYKRR